MRAETRAECIKRLNDAFRSTFLGGKLVMSHSFAAMPETVRDEALQRVRTFTDFTKDNDPYGEHDCAVFEIDGQRFMFKIDYFDKSMEYGSEDPADPEETTRVLTIMMPSDY